MNVNIDIEPGTENVFPEKFVLTSFFDCALEDLRSFRELASYIYVRGAGIEGEAGNGDAFQQLMRVVMGEVAVLKRARLGFVRGRDQIARLLAVRLQETAVTG